MAQVRFGVLGGLEVEADAGPLTIAGPRRRALLALLVVHANRVVSTGRVIDSLWGEDAPASARAQVHSLISALRQELPDPADGGPAIETRPEGYMLAVDPGGVDVFVFEKRVAAARVEAGAGRLEQAVASFRQALELWRGPALDGIEAPFADTEAARLEGQRLVVTEEAVEVDLALGHHTEIVGELGALVAEHPYQERLQAALMLALYRSGRRADALEVCRNARRSMVEELGLDPGRTLQDLEQAMLRDEPSLALAPRTPSPPAVTDGETVGEPTPPAAASPSSPSVPPPRRRTRKVAVGVALLIVVGIALTALSRTVAPSNPAAVAAPYTCVGAPFSWSRYCIAHVLKNAPLYRSNGTLYTRLLGNTAVKVTCWYRANGAFQDHVTWENIAHPITGHIPDASVNIENHEPNSSAVALHQCG